MNLVEFVEKYPHLKPIYNILKPYLMANPENIEIYHLSELPKFGFEPRDTVMACALQPNKLFFRDIPPSEYDFAHELIHLCIKPDDVHEEIYGYNLAPIILFAVKEEGLENIDPFKLFELTEQEINNILRKYGFKDIDDFYRVQGVIPYTHELKETEQGLEFVRRPEYTEKDHVITFIAELSGGIQYFDICRKILKDILLLTTDF